jgi:perosamine synthetase
MVTEPIPYGRQSVSAEDIEAVVDVLRSDYLTTGPAVTRFEDALTSATGAAGVVAVSSGTAALHAAYAACGLGPGTELVTTPLTFMATASAALHLGASVRFADVEDDTLTLSPQTATEAVNSATRVIAPVDFAGHPADLDALGKVAKQADAVLVEDAAHSIGAQYQARPVGSIASLTTFSFHPVKTITTGEGGAVATIDAAWLDSLRRFRNHGLVRDTNHQHQPNEGGWHQEVHELGLNYRMPDILAALGTSQLARLQYFLSRRAQLVARYFELLRDVELLRLPSVRDGVQPAWHLMPVRIQNGRRRQVYEHLRSCGIGVQVHYLPVHRHPLFQALGYRPDSCPVAEAAYEELLSLPLYPDLSEAQQHRIATELQRALNTQAD